MEEKKRIICIKKQGIYFTPQDFMPLGQTNIPEDAIRFRTHEDIFWEVELINYDPRENSLIIEITDYTPEDITSFYRQTIKKTIKKLKIKSLRWSAIERSLSYYQKSALLPLLEDEPITPIHPSQTQISAVDEDEDFMEDDFQEDDEDEEFEVHEPFLGPMIKREPIKTEKTIKFAFPWVEVQFHPGYVSLTKNQKDFNEPLFMRIYNPHLVPEFFYLLPFFEKLFKRKTLDVTAKIFMEDYEIVDIQAHSPQLNRINDQVIDQIKGMRLMKISGEHLSPKDKSFFTPEDILEELEKLEPELGNRFLPDPEHLLNEFLLLKGARNAKQIMYLAGKLQQVNQKIRFSLEPYFGFVFVIEGQKMRHFCWELLDSMATYLWSIDKNLYSVEWQLNTVEELVNLVRTLGRNRYRQEWRLQQQVNEQFTFQVIDHEHINSALVDGFVYWKQKLEEKLV